MVMPPIIPPVPPDKVLKFIGKVMPIVLDFLGSIIDGLASKKAVTKNSTTEEIEDINAFFREFRQKIDGQAKENEKLLLKDIKNFADDLRWVANTDNPIFSKYNVRFNRFERKVAALPEQLNGVMMDKISRVVSLDSPECSKVIRMLPGSEKNKAVDELFRSACRQGQEAVLNKTGSLCDELLEEYQETVSDAIEQLSISVKARECELEQLLSCKDSDEAEICLAQNESVKQAADLLQAVLAEEMI